MCVQSLDFLTHCYLNEFNMSLNMLNMFTYGMNVRVVLFLGLSETVVCNVGPSSREQGVGSWRSQSTDSRSSYLMTGSELSHS